MKSFSTGYHGQSSTILTILRGDRSGFTIVELLIVIVVIGILAAITIAAYNGVQAKARDSARISKVKSISNAIELYNIDNGRYPPIQDGQGQETSCGSQTENWGHCDRSKMLADMLAPYTRIDSTSLSNATQGNYWYRTQVRQSTTIKRMGCRCTLKVMVVRTMVAISPMVTN